MRAVGAVEAVCCCDGLLGCDVPRVISEIVIQQEH